MNTIINDLKAHVAAEALIREAITVCAKLAHPELAVTRRNNFWALEGWELVEGRPGAGGYILANFEFISQSPESKTVKIALPFFEGQYAGILAKAS